MSNTILVTKNTPINYMALPGVDQTKTLNFAFKNVISPEIIETIVCRHFGIDIKEIRGMLRKQYLVNCRQIIMFLVRKYSLLSLKDIGRRYTRHHTTIISALRAVQDHMDTEPQFKATIKHLELIII